jgi:hypothetical protein
MLFYRETQTVTFGRMNTNNAHLSNQIGDTSLWHDARIRSQIRDHNSAVRNVYLYFLNKIDYSASDR